MKLLLPAKYMIENRIITNLFVILLLLGCTKNKEYEAVSAVSEGFHYEYHLAGPVEGFMIDSTFFDNVKYFGPSHLNQYLGFYYFLVKFKNLSQRKETIVFNNDSTGILRFYDFYKLVEKNKAKFCHFNTSSTSKGYRWVSCEVEPGEEILYLIPLASNSFNRISRFYKSSIDLVPYYTCFSPLVSNSNENDLIWPKVMCNSCYYRKNGIWIGEKISIDKILPNGLESRYDFSECRDTIYASIDNDYLDILIRNNFARFLRIPYDYWLVNNKGELHAEYLMKVNKLFEKDKYFYVDTAFRTEDYYLSYEKEVDSVVWNFMNF